MAAKVMTLLALRRPSTLASAVFRGVTGILSILKGERGLEFVFVSFSTVVFLLVSGIISTLLISDTLEVGAILWTRALQRSIEASGCLIGLHFRGELTVGPSSREPITSANDASDANDAISSSCEALANGPVI